VHGIGAKLEARLAAAQFLRVHHSTLVNVSSIQAFKRLSHGEHRIAPCDGTHSPAVAPIESAWIAW